jgi:hypothetical protein
MRVGILNNLGGEKQGLIIEEDGGDIRGEGKGESLVEQAPLKTFDDWRTTLHHSSYLRFVEGSTADIES